MYNLPGATMEDTSEKLKSLQQHTAELTATMNKNAKFPVEWGVREDKSEYDGAPRYFLYFKVPALNIYTESELPKCDCK